MKWKISCCLIITAALLTACGKTDKKPEAPAILAKKYAKYRVPVYKDIEMKTWAATLSKAESVDLLDVQEQPDKKNKIKIAKIRLSDDTVGFLQEKHLADQPIVFIEDTKIHVRNNPSSRIYAEIPMGTIAFIIAEKADWIQIYAGQIDGKWITKQWGKQGYSTDMQLILQARTYEDAVEILQKEKSEQKQDELEKALKDLEELQNSESIFAELARKTLENISEKPEDLVTEGKETEQPQKEENKKE